MALKNTGVMCMVHIGEDSVDMGNYYINEENHERVLVTRRELAEKYAQLVPVPVYVRRPTPLALDGANAPDFQQVLPADVLVGEGTLPEPPRQ